MFGTGYSLEQSSFRLIPKIQRVRRISHRKLERQNRSRTRSPRWTPLIRRPCVCETAKAETIGTGYNMRRPQSPSSRYRCAYFGDGAPRESRESRHHPPFGFGRRTCQTAAAMWWRRDRLMMTMVRILRTNRFEHWVPIQRGNQGGCWVGWAGG